MKKYKSVAKLWGGAFSAASDEAVISFTAGRDVSGVSPADTKLIPYDLWCNKAHCVMLYQCGIISEKDARVILKGLGNIEKLFYEQKFILDPTKEDVHSNIESWLINKYGIETAGKLHTARSRNDQIALDMRLYMRDSVLSLAESLLQTATILVLKADEYKEICVPGFTHYQHAMVTTFGHILASYATMTLRDVERLKNWLAIYNTNPLGASASYGTSFPTNSTITTTFFGFVSSEESSLDSITNRWEAEADVVFILTTVMNHLSSLSQTLIVFSTPEFGMVKLSEKYSTGSSIMPQKKNPDPLEVIKGKASYVAGLLASLLSIGKGTFIGYNRDTQWSKYIIMDAIRECLAAPIVMKGVVETLLVNSNSMATWCKRGFIGATHLMETISQKCNLSLRESKILIEKAIMYSSENKSEHVTFDSLQKAMKELKLNLSLSEKEIELWQDPSYILTHCISIGGPGLLPMKRTLKKLRSSIEKDNTWLHTFVTKKNNALRKLENTISNIILRRE